VPLTPREKDALVALERQLRGDDPALATTLARGPRPRHTHTLLTRQIATLLGALFVVVGIGPFAADKFGIIGVGVVTSLVIVPWLVAASRAAARRPGLSVEPFTTFSRRA
jgi:hypothetical protein